MNMPVEIRSATVVERRDLTPDLMIMKLAPSVPFTFKPGQYCTIGVDGIWRPYSIVSAPHEKTIELFLELVPEQLRTNKSLTPKLWKLHEGDSIALVPRAKGVFLLDQSFSRQVMVATVTGIAPFVSMIRARCHNYYQNLKDPSEPWYVFQGASYADEFGYQEELQEFAHMRIIEYVPTVSRPQESRNAGWKAKQGRVNEILLAELDARNIAAYGNTMCYLCGNEGMILNLGSRKNGTPCGQLIAQGFPVTEEVFF